MPANMAINQKRPSSPYQPKNIKNGEKTRVWRSLNGTGFAHARHQDLESRKAAWLQSLRLGTGVSHPSPYQQTHGSRKTREQVNAALASSSDYLKQQLGFRVNGNDAVAASPRPGTPQYKPKEDMYDEIIELKKTIQLQKHDNDRLKTKLRWNEEENVKKDKIISQLVEEALVMHNGKFTTKGDQVLIKTMKSQQMRSNSQIESLQNDIKDFKLKLKQLKTRCKAAKSKYVEQVQQLQGAIKRQDHEIKLLSGEEVDDNLVDENDMKKSKLATDISTLRQSVVKLTCENTKLKEDCLLVRKDLQTAMLKNDESAADSERELKVCEDKITRLKAAIDRIKKEKSQVFSENNEKSEEIKRLVKNLDESKDEVKVLREEIALLESKVESQKDLISNRSRPTTPVRSRSNSRVEKVEQLRRSNSRTEKVELFRRNKAARTIQHKWKDYKHNEEYEANINVIQSSFRGHLARQQYITDSSQTFKQRAEYADDDVTILQSSMRGHQARSEMLTNY